MNKQKLTKKKKNKERVDAYQAERDRKERRYGYNSPSSGKWNDKASAEKRKRANELVKDFNDGDKDVAKKLKDVKNFDNFKKQEKEAHDAANRHDRRHAAKQKANEAFDFLDSIEYPYNG